MGASFGDQTFVFSSFLPQYSDVYAIAFLGEKAWSFLVLHFADANDSIPLLLTHLCLYEFCIGKMKLGSFFIFIMIVST